MPMFYMMVGLPGSGKSFTAESIPNAVVHSSDAIRAEVLGDENDQTQQDLVFQTLHTLCAIVANRWASNASKCSAALSSRTSTSSPTMLDLRRQ